MNRRCFLLQASASFSILHPVLRAQKQACTRLRILSDVVGTTIPVDLMGLSYESTQLGEPDFFSSTNAPLVALCRQLCPTGVLRLGGNTSEFTFFQAMPETTAPAYRPKPTQPDKLTAITPAALGQLRGFLDATGWTCIYGLNLGLGTPECAAEEAAAVTAILGPRLKYFQIGNEANNYIRYKLRPATWTPEAFAAEWISFAEAILQRVPQAKLGGPDMGAEAVWMRTFAELAVPRFRAALVELSDHFYAEGPPDAPASTIENLLHGVKILDEIAVMQKTGHRTGLSCRMTEVNSCYMGGKPGVSDTFASTLWSADLTLRLLAAGFTGVNFHGGSALHIKASLGGTLPGDQISKSESNDSYYTPIALGAQQGLHARPIFDGMALAAKAAGGRQLRVQGTDPDLTAYAFRRSRAVELFLFNLGLKPRRAALENFRSATAEILSATSLQSKSVVHQQREIFAPDFILPPATAMRLVMARP